MGFTNHPHHSCNVTQFYYFQLSDTRALHHSTLRNIYSICIASRLCYCRRSSSCLFDCFFFLLRSPSLSHTHSCYMCMQFYVSDLCLLDFLHTECMATNNQKRALVTHTPSAMFLDEMRSMPLHFVPFSQIILIEMNEYASQHTHKHMHQLMCVLLCDGWQSAFSLLYFTICTHANAHTHIHVHNET